MNNFHLTLIGLVILNIGLGQLSSSLPFIVTGILILTAVTVATAVDLFIPPNSSKGKNGPNQGS